MLFAHEITDDSLLAKELAKRAYGEKTLWDTSEQLTLEVLNTLRFMAYLDRWKIWNESGRKGPEPKAPEHTYAPGFEPEKPKMASPQQVIDFLGSLR